MTDLINAINGLNTRDWFDYFSAFTSLLLSFVAILIAVSTARRQNRIAIFERRYCNYTELLEFNSKWKMFIEQYFKLIQENRNISNNLICKLCLGISIISSEEIQDINVLSFVKDNSLDRDRIHNEYLNFNYKASMMLEIASLLNGRVSKKIENFHKRYIMFAKQVENILFERISQDAFEIEVIAFRKCISEFHKIIHMHIVPKVLLKD